MKEIPGEAHPLLQFCPVLHTSMLYWAAKFEESKISVKLMEKIMSELEAYPEGPVSMENGRTPCHAAAELGDHVKLKALLKDVNMRYIIKKKKES